MARTGANYQATKIKENGLPVGASLYWKDKGRTQIRRIVERRQIGNPAAQRIIRPVISA